MATNAQGGKILVQKFGGTSVGTGERLKNVAGIIAASRKKNPVIAVVSAMSSVDKKQGTTSLLLAAADAAMHGRSFARPLNAIRRNHIAALEEVAPPSEERTELEAWLDAELKALAGFLDAIEVIRELSPRSEDILLSVGERLSARLLTATLEAMGIPAVFTDLSKVVPEGNGDAPDPAFYRKLQRKLGALCDVSGGAVPVVTGFFGMVPGGLLKAVGRGYTDFTTALISAGKGNAQVAEMQVWKEVDGIFTADPRRVPTARVLETITPSEAAELTYFGSEVLHPFTMERVVSANIPIRIKNTFNPEGKGTLILPGERPKAKTLNVTAVTAKRGITIVTISSNRMYNAYGFLARVFDVLAEGGVVVDLVSTSEVSISFTVDRLTELKRVKPRLERLGDVEIVPGRAILAMVGEGMKFSKGTAGRMFNALGAGGVNIEMISQGASEINISCVIAEEDVEGGVQAVHDAFMQ